MAKLNLERGDFSGAQYYLKRFAAASPHNAESLWIGIQTERALGDQNRAASYLLKLNSSFPNSVEARLALESEAR